MNESNTIDGREMKFYILRDLLQKPTKTPPLRKSKVNRHFLKYQESKDFVSS